MGEYLKVKTWSSIFNARIYGYLCSISHLRLKSSRHTLTDMYLASFLVTVDAYH